MHQAPARIHIRMVQQPLHRPAAAPGQAVVHFALLFGDMDVHRRLAGQLRDLIQVRRRHGPQAVRCHAHQRTFQATDCLAARRQQAREALDVIREATLRTTGDGAAEISVGIQHWQQGQADTALGGRRGRANGQLRQLCIR